MRVLISGAGIAGPTLAYFLAKNGSHVTIVEKSPSILDLGQNIDLSGSSLTVCKKMGILDEVRRFNTTEKGTQFIAPNGKPFAPFPMGKGRPSPTSEFEILRGDLSVILYKASKDLPNVKYLFGTTVTNVISNDDAGVKVEISTGEVQDFDMLVAADGQWSKLRRQCFSPDDVQIVDKDAYISYWTTERVPEDNDWWNIYFAPRRRVISLRPDPYGTIRAGFSLMPTNDAQRQEWKQISSHDREAYKALLKKEFADAGWQASRLLEGIDKASDFYFHPLQQIRMRKWSTSRVVLMGDAAHAPTPLTGYGTPLAMIGAYVLAGELSKLDSGEHPAKAFEAYDRVYRPFVEKIQDIPSFVPGIAHQPTAWRIWLLQVVIATMSKVLESKWVAKKVSGDKDPEDDNDGFPLPSYPNLKC